MAMIKALIRDRRLSRRAREEIEFYISIAPWLIGFLLFSGGPLLVSLGMSFTNWTGMTTREWIGLGNYVAMFTTDHQFLTVLRNTLYYSFGTVTLGMVASLAVALLMNQKVPGINIFRTLYYLPSVTSGVAVAIMFSWLFNAHMGLVNYLLSLVGIPGPPWLGSQEWAMPALILMSLWGVGSNMIVLLAGLQGIPEELYDAVKVDGANKWQGFRNVTLPLLSPALFFVMIVSIINSFQVFDFIYVMTEGGPGNATRVFVYHLYQNAFEYQKMGYASALAWVLFLIILGLTWLQFRAGKHWVYYEAVGEGK